MCGPILADAQLMSPLGILAYVGKSWAVKATEYGRFLSDTCALQGGSISSIHLAWSLNDGQHLLFKERQPETTQHSLQAAAHSRLLGCLVQVIRSDWLA